MTVIVLAAGLSRRMGRNKLLLDFGGVTVIERTVRTALLFTSSVIVVTGHESEKIESVLSGYRAKIVSAPDYMKGQIFSTRAGIENSSGDFAVIPGDLPLVTEEDYRTGLDLLTESSIARPVHEGVPGHPVFFKSFHRIPILSFGGTMKEYISNHKVAEYEGSIGTVLDADDEEQYRRMLSML